MRPELRYGVSALIGAVIAIFICVSRYGTSDAIRIILWATFGAIGGLLTVRFPGRSGF